MTVYISTHCHSRSVYHTSLECLNCPDDHKEKELRDIEPMLDKCSVCEDGYDRDSEQAREDRKQALAYQLQHGSLQDYETDVKYQRHG